MLPGPKSQAEENKKEKSFFYPFSFLFLPRSYGRYAQGYGHPVSRCVTRTVNDR